jgi:hypothetical protein
LVQVLQQQAALEGRLLVVLLDTLEVLVVAAQMVLEAQELLGKDLTAAQESLALIFGAVVVVALVRWDLQGLQVKAAVAALV